MAIGVRRISTIFAALVVAAVFAPAGWAKASQMPAYPTVYVKYAMNCTFTVYNDEGARISSIPPGTYQVEVSTPVMFKLVVPGGVGVDHIAPNDFTGCKGWVQFSMTGPGVNLFTTLDSGCDAFLILGPVTFAPGATYVLQDMWQPAVTRTTLTVAGTGAPDAPVSPYGATSGKGSVSVDIVGSAVKAAVTRISKRATLASTLAAGAKRPTLVSGGKPVSIVKAGQYRFVVTDKDPKRGLILRQANGKAINLTSAKFVGKKTVTVTLRPGRWLYYADHRNAYPFTVIR